MSLKDWNYNLLSKIVSTELKEFHHKYQLYLTKHFSILCVTTPSEPVISLYDKVGMGRFTLVAWIVYVINESPLTAHRCFLDNIFTPWYVEILM